MKEKIRILYLINNLRPGGAQRYIVDVIHAIDRTMYDVRIVCLGGDNYFKDEIDITCYNIGIDKYNPKITKLTRLVNIINEYKPHIMHTHLQYADTIGQLFGKIYNIPIIITTIHGFVEWNRKKLTVKSIVEDFAIKKADLVIAVSEPLVTYLVESRHVQINKMVCVPCSVNIMPFIDTGQNRVSRRRYYSYNENDIVFACTAHFRPEKRHDLLLKKFVHLILETQYSAKLLLIGNDGNLTGDVKNWINSLGLQNDVIISGGDRQDVVKDLAASDIFVMHSEEEGKSLAVVEAMAAGLPLLLPRLSHFTGQVDDGKHALFYDFNSTQEFADKAKILIANTDYRHYLGENGKKKAIQEYSIEHHLQILSGLYVRLFERYIGKKLK